MFGLRRGCFVPNLFTLVLVPDVISGDYFKEDGWNFHFRRNLCDWEMVEAAEIYTEDAVCCIGEEQGRCYSMDNLQRGVYSVRPFHRVLQKQMEDYDTSLRTF